MKPVGSSRYRWWQVVCGLLVAGASAPATAVILEEIVARVNDEIIVRSEVEKRREQLTRQIMAQYPGQEGEGYMREAEENLLFDMINEELLMQQAKLNFDMDTYFENVKKEFMSNNDIATDKELNELLAVEGVDMDGFRRLLLRSNVPQDVLKFDVRLKISVSDAEIQAYYDEHLAS